MKSEFDINVENKAKYLWEKFYLKSENYDDEKFGWLISSINETLTKKIIIDLIDEIIDANKKASYTIEYTNVIHAKELDAKVRSEIHLFYVFWEMVKKEIKKM